MKKRMLTIGILSAVAIVAILFTFSQGLFSTDVNAIDTYIAYEKNLGKLFVKYSDTMTDEELSTWQDEVDAAAAKAANALIRIQKDPDDWRYYLASTGQPYRPSPFAPIEFTGFAAKSPKEITSDEFYDWLAARDKQMDDHRRARLKADGIWDDEKIEQMIAKTNASLANNPERQANREKWRQLIIEKEGRPARERERSDREGKESEYHAWRDEQNAWHAAEQKKIDQMLSESSEMPPEGGVPAESDFQTVPEDDFDTFDSMSPLEGPSASDEDVEAGGPGLEGSQALPFPDVPAFDRDAFDLMLSEDMSRWDDTLRESYQDVFDLDASFEERLPREARTIVNERRQRLQSEYVRRIDDVLRDIPREDRAETLRIVGDRLSETWDSDFTDAVIKQLERNAE